jgi:Rrf2 family iron-sulfur cluster assembly transcriptional regulator
MKLTLSVGYGVAVLLRIQAHADEGPVTAAKIARGCRFPRRFLYRVLHKLVDAGLLYGTSGPGGGYALARSPARITLLDIVAGVESRPAQSVLAPACPGQSAAIRRVNQLCRESAARFAAELKHVSLADLERLDKRGRNRHPASRAAGA